MVPVDLPKAPSGVHLAHSRKQSLDRYHFASRSVHSQHGEFPRNENVPMNVGKFTYSRRVPSYYRMAGGSPGMAGGSPGMAGGSPNLTRGSPNLTRGSPNLTRGSPCIPRGSPGMAAMHQAKVCIYAFESLPFLGAGDAIGLFCTIFRFPCLIHGFAQKTRETDIFAELQRHTAESILPVLPAVVFGDRTYVTTIGTVRSLARKIGLYGWHDKCDYIADAVLESLQGWREHQEYCIKCFLSGEVAKGLPYMNSRSRFYLLLSQCLRHWHLLYRDPELQVCWVDPLVFAILANDLIFDAFLRAKGHEVTEPSEVLQEQFQYVRSYFETVSQELFPHIGAWIRRKIDSIVRPPVHAPVPKQP